MSAFSLQLPGTYLAWKYNRTYAKSFKALHFYCLNCFNIFDKFVLQMLRATQAPGILIWVAPRKYVNRIEMSGRCRVI